MGSALAPSTTVAVIGSGTMGAGIAQVAAAAGHVVKLFDGRPGAADKAVAGIRHTFARLVEKGKIGAHEAELAGMRLRPASVLADVADAGLAVEAITENLDAKRGLFAELEAIVGEGCILATNTSSISITAIGAGLARPGRLVGMHFFNPAPLMALVEVVSGLATERGHADTVYATAQAWGKVPVHAASTPGFIVNRVARPYYAEAMRVAQEQGATPATLDAVLRDAGGFRMGPFELMDLIGHDVNFAVTSTVYAGYFNDPRFTPSVMQQELVNAGFLGRKTGRGFYRYGPDAPAPEPAVEHARPAPAQVSLRGSHPRFAAGFDAVASRAREAGVVVARKPDTCGGDACIDAGTARIFLTDGRTATRRAADTGYRDIVLIDLAGDFASARRVALARSAQCSAAAYDAAVGLFQAAGYVVSPLADVPGMIVMRTIAMLANEAADTVNQGVCSARAVDIAMEKGVNYPRGPLAWADAIGVGELQTVLRNLAATYGEDRYRISPLIQHKVAAQEALHG